MSLCSLNVRAELVNPVGHIQYARGSISAEHPGEGLRILGSGSIIYTHDLISTSDKSFSVIQFEDNTRMSLRANTEFLIEEYHYEQQHPSNNVGLFQFLRGGARILTGLINKFNPDSINIKAAAYTIGIRGTELDLRICKENDCSEEASSILKRRNKLQYINSSSRVIGRVAYLTTSLSANNIITDKSRTISKGGPIYEGDELITGDDGYALIAFRDASRVTLLKNTRYSVDEFKFKPFTPPENQSFFSLVRGGIRALTGKIALLNKSKVEYSARTYTIGVRGTGFDLVHQKKCEQDGDSDTSLCQETPDLATIDPFEDNVYAHVWKDSIVIHKNNNETILEEDQIALLNDSADFPQILKELPLSLQNLSGPRPDTVDIDIESMFGTVKLKQLSPHAGLYVSVYDGHVVIQNTKGEEINLGAYEAAFGDENDNLYRIDEIPIFQLYDDIPKPLDFNEQHQNFLAFLGQDNSAVDTSLQCSIY